MINQILKNVFLGFHITFLLDYTVHRCATDAEFAR
jgi:hypothetical protein